jgi:hypothetical protein
MDRIKKVEDTAPETAEEVKKDEVVPVVAEQTLPTDNRIWWRKVGGGSLRIGKRIIKPNEKFQASPEDIKPAFRDLVVPLEDVPEIAGNKVPTVIKSEYKLQPRGKSNTWFDVVDKNGKVLNDKGMQKDKAEKLIKDLES